MANRRMFSKAVVDSDSFLEMPLSAQALYFHLGMRADDDGFISSAKSILRMLGASEEDMKILAEKEFILSFDSGVIAISHWKVHNQLRADRYTPTVHEKELSMLEEGINKIYQFGNQMATQYSIGKESSDKNSEDKKREAEESPAHSPPVFFSDKYEYVKLTDKQYENLVSEYGQKLTDFYILKMDKYCKKSGKVYADHELKIREWILKDGAYNDGNSGKNPEISPASSCGNDTGGSASLYSTDI